MLEYFGDYGVFLAKTITVVVALLFSVAGIMALAGRGKKAPTGHLEVQHLNGELEDMEYALQEALVDKEVVKKQLKQKKKEDKAKAKARKQALKQGKPLPDGERKRVFVLDFDGDLQATAVEPLKKAITAVLTAARPIDEVVVRLESSGGVVHGYGFAASQLLRIRQQNIPLTVCVDKVAASGGYMMACTANKILAAPFAVLGSIGVVAQIPNFHRLLKKNDIDFEVLTAGEHKRTMTIFGENTEKGRQKFLEDLEDTHHLFKSFVVEHRPQLDIEEVSNGDVWFGLRALNKQLVDELKTSDEYLAELCREADVYEVSYKEKKNLQERLGLALQGSLDRLLLTWWERLQRMRFYS